MSAHDPRNIVITCMEVEKKLDKGHVCLIPQDNKNIQVWLLLCRALCLQSLGDALMQCPVCFIMLRFGIEHMPLPFLSQVKVLKKAMLASKGDERFVRGSPDLMWAQVDG